MARHRLGQQRAQHHPHREARRDRHPKGDRARSILIASYLRDILREHHAAQAARGQLHTLVFSAPTLWLASGESIYFVQQQLGHKDIQTTIDLDTHPDKAAHRDAAERAAGWWREVPSEGSQVPRAVPQAGSVVYTLGGAGTTGSAGTVSRV